MESDNPFIRLMMFGRIKKMMNSYKGIKLKDIDKKLIKGLFIRNIKEFDEDEKEKWANKSLLQRLKFAF